MKYGMNLLLWTDDPTLECWLPLYERLKRMGFDGVELPLLGATPERLAILGRRLDDMGLERTAVNVRSVEEDPIAGDAAIRAAARAGLERTIDYAKRSGISLTLEFLNRFEIYLLNCTADTVRFVRDVGRAMKAGSRSKPSARRCRPSRQRRASGDRCSRTRRSSHATDSAS